MARDQIRAGVWYKPSWWDAFRHVPVDTMLGRIKKKDVPKLQFIEDRLIREFETKNPMIAKMDYFDFHSSNPDSVAARFGAKQVEEMAKGLSEADAYKAAEDWLIRNGKEIVERLDWPPEFRKHFEMNPDMERPMEDIWTDDMKREQQALKDGLAADLRSRPSTPRLGGEDSDRISGSLTPKPFKSS